MARKVREVMTAPPLAVEPRTPVAEVARTMRDDGIGAVLVTEGGTLRGLVTDRDLVVRVLSRGGNPDEHTVAEACSEDLVSVRPEDDIGRAAALMRDRAVRRLPVVEGSRPVGIVSLGDLAVERDPGSALADISASDPNE
ncbi:CBS domain-containing protein [Streptomyces sp. YIM 98790]|uniref:CBS domain-containing protein n=1 Tax=Streptomyces sp. YIM 98790 TaxID=2689077 RepID=UPI00140D9430|nr:CBS domain-containing protein [Streptomyces sp. YIM 98790]